MKHSCKTFFMPNNIKVGQIGENIACEYLLNNKYKILDRNVRYPWGEIDIISQSKNGVLVFVEVKALKCFTECFTPEENLSAAKLEKVKRTAYLYANSHPKLIKEKSGWRIDLIAIEINHREPDKLDPKELLACSRIRHYENI